VLECTQKRASWTSALVLNNPVVDHCLQQDGVIPLTKELNFTKLPRDEWDILGVPTADDCRSVPKSVPALHDFFMSDPDHFHQLTGVNIVPPPNMASVSMSCSLHRIKFAGGKHVGLCLMKWPFVAAMEGTTSVSIFSGVRLLCISTVEDNNALGLWTTNLRNNISILPALAWGLMKTKRRSACEHVSPSLGFRFTAASQ
jgi:hypothetical protein